MMAAILAVRQSRKRHRNRLNPLQLTNRELIAEFCLPKLVILELCELLREDYLQPNSASKRALTVEEQVFIARKTLVSGMMFILYCVGLPVCNFYYKTKEKQNVIS